MKIAISYLRFSSMLQASGDSFRRQNANRDDWLKRNPDVTLEKELNDFGLSAFKAHHVSKGDLGDFLEFIKSPSFAERVELDEVFLLVESLDRLSREKVMTALHQLEAIVKAGVKVVTLADGQTYDRDSLNDLGGLIVAIVTMSRAYNESKIKSDRIKEAFTKNRQNARNGGIYNGTHPAWINVIGGGYEIIEEFAIIIRGIIRNVASGIEIQKICVNLTMQNIPTLSQMKGRKTKSNQWAGSSIRSLLERPTPIGTLWTKDGEIENHYPKIIDSETFAKARQVLNNNKSQRGKVSKHCNLFRKIATDPYGEPVYLKSRGNGCYLPRSAHKGLWFEGSTWHKKQLDSIVLHTMRLALNVEKSTKGDEAKLAKVEDDILKLKKKIKNLEELLEDEPDKGLFKRKKDREVERDTLKSQASRIRDNILAGGQKTILDPRTASMEEVQQALRVNVKNMIIDFKNREISVELVNGVKYKASLTKDSEVIVETNDFEVGETISFELLRE